MTKTFERFLRVLTDKELVLFAQERGRLQPPYWKVLRVALRIEAGRRGLDLGDGQIGPAPANVAAPGERAETA